MSLLKNIKGREGFTLIEILVALSLVSIVLYVVSGSAVNNRRHLEEALDTIERSIRFGADEAALKNSFLRVHFYMDKEPQSFALEAGPSGGFLLKKEEASNYNEKETIASKEAAKKRKKISSRFSRIQEFAEEDKEFNDNVRLIAFASSLTDGLITEADPALYISPTGEKDSALIVIGTDEEVVALSIDPFTLDMKRDYHKFDEPLDYDEMEEPHNKVAKEFFEKWQKSN